MNPNLKHGWTINGLLAVILALLGGLYLAQGEPRAYAEGGGWETGGVVAGTSSDVERIVIVDTKKQNIMIYKSATGRQLRLVGARSYKYDVEIFDSAGTPIEGGGQGKTFSDVFKYYNAEKDKQK